MSLEAILLKRNRFNRKKFIDQEKWVIYKPNVIFLRNNLSSSNLMGLYVGFVLLLYRLLRPLFRNLMYIIMFDDMPYVDRVLQLCLDIYLVRESRDFILEEDLFSKLIFFFRSTELMIMWTRPPEENIRQDLSQ